MAPTLRVIFAQRCPSYHHLKRAIYVEWSFNGGLDYWFEDNSHEFAEVEAEWKIEMQPRKERTYGRPRRQRDRDQFERRDNHRDNDRRRGDDRRPVNRDRRRDDRHQSNHHRERDDRHIANQSRRRHDSDYSDYLDHDGQRNNRRGFQDHSGPMNIGVESHGPSLPMMPSPAMIDDGGLVQLPAGSFDSWIVDDDDGGDNNSIPVPIPSRRKSVSWASDVSDNTSRQKSRRR